MRRSQLTSFLLVAVILATLFWSAAPTAAQEVQPVPFEPINPFPAPPNKIYISADMANVRTGPRLTAPVVFKFPKDDYVLVKNPVQGDDVDGNSTWYETKSGYYISETVTVNTPGTKTMEFTGPKADRWIQVDISDGKARAMQGNKPVYEAKVATGRPDKETPLGTFSIQWRAETRTMDSSTIGVPLDSEDGYLIPYVRYAQYFTTKGDALHGNFWVPPEDFGSGRTSRGCVGMSNDDAKIFWEFGFVGLKVVVQM